ncbi:cyclic nucleotide-binding domain-containing protein [Myxococcota bacterium]|nr:cyclic nucleotide-binding domain-containing protein [Myxococcota bacterium]
MALEDTQMGSEGDFEREFDSGAVIFDEGDPGDHLYVIRRGSVELSREGVAGSRVIAMLGPGDFFGELAVVLGQPSNARAVAMEHTRVLELDRATLERVCVEQSEVAIRLIRVLVSRLIECERRLVALGVDDLLRPVVRALLRSARPVAGDSSSEALGGIEGFRIALNLRSLAEQAGLGMSEAHRAVHRLFDLEVLELVDGCLVASDLEALSACLD